MVVRVSINRAGIHQVLHGEGAGGHVHRYVRRLGREGVRLSRAGAPVKTGRLRAGIQVTDLFDGPRVVRLTFASTVKDPKTGKPYGIYQEVGTGIYAGRGFIYPKRKKFLRFVPGRKAGPTRSGRLRPRGRGYVYARKVRGTPAMHYMRQGLMELAALHPELGIRILR